VKSTNRNDEFKYACTGNAAPPVIFRAQLWAVVASAIRHNPHCKQQRKTTAAIPQTMKLFLLGGAGARWAQSTFVVSPIR
jgi:hypothetical protein